MYMSDAFYMDVTFKNKYVLLQDIPQIRNVVCVDITYYVQCFLRVLYL